MNGSNVLWPRKGHVDCLIFYRNNMDDFLGCKMTEQEEQKNPRVTLLSWAIIYNLISIHSITMMLLMSQWGHMKRIQFNIELYFLFKSEENRGFN